LLPQAVQTSVKEYLTATNALTDALVKQHLSALDALNKQLAAVRKTLANEHKYEPAMFLLEQSQSLTPVFEPILVKAAMGRRPFSQFSWEASVLDAKEGSFLLLYKMGSATPEWVPRDKFAVGRGSGDSEEATRDVLQRSKDRQHFPPGVPAFRVGRKPPGVMVTNAVKLSKGDHVYVSSGGGWYKATVVAESDAEVIIHYDGLAEIWDTAVNRGSLFLKKD
jgi:hypothetical protein